jgi:hypothetical protein
LCNAISGLDNRKTKKELTFARSTLFRYVALET